MRGLPEHLREHFRHPRCVGAPPQGHDLEGAARNPACGDHLVVYLAVRQGRVAAAGFRAQGCPVALGTGSAAVELLPGLSADETLPQALVERFADAYGKPARAHHHALALFAAGLRAAVSVRLAPGGSPAD